MVEQHTDHHRVTVVAAKIAAELHHAEVMARRLMLSSNVVALTPRVEAQHAGEFRSGLIQMASLIREQTAAIKRHVTQSVSLLNDAMDKLSDRETASRKQSCWHRK